MSDRDAYIALVTSLPSSERLFVARQPPLSRLRLDRRLSALTAHDRSKLQRIEHLLSWSHYGMDDTGDGAQARLDSALEGLESDTLRAIVTERIAMRTLIAALRQRAAGAAGPEGLVGPRSLLRAIARHWQEPVFGLDRQMPWLPQAAALMAERDPLGLERHVLDVTFRQLQRHGAAHVFDFEAVVIYVLKWNIFDRWARSDATAAKRRFERLADAALAACRLDGAVRTGAGAAP